MKLKGFKLFKESKNEKPYTNFDWSKVFHHDTDYIMKLIKTTLFKYDIDDLSSSTIYEELHYTTNGKIYEVEDYKILPGTELLACYLFDDIFPRKYEREVELEEALNDKLEKFGMKCSTNRYRGWLRIYDTENTYTFTTEDFLNFFSITDYRLSEKGGLYFQVPMSELINKFVSDKQQETWLEEGYIEWDYYGDYPDRSSAIDYYISKENLDKMCLYLRKTYGEELKDLMDLNDNYTDKDIINALKNTRRGSFDDDEINDMFSLCVDYYNSALQDENWKDLYNEFIEEVEKDIPSLTDLGWVQVNGKEVRMFEGAFELDNPSYMESMDAYVKTLDKDGYKINSNYYDRELYGIVFEYLGDCSKRLEPHYSDYPSKSDFEENLNKEISHSLDYQLKKLEGKSE